MSNLQIGPRCNLLRRFSILTLHSISNSRIPPDEFRIKFKNYKILVYQAFIRSSAGRRQVTTLAMQHVAQRAILLTLTVYGLTFADTYVLRCVCVLLCDRSQPWPCNLLRRFSNLSFRSLSAFQGEQRAILHLPFLLTTYVALRLLTLRCVVVLMCDRWQPCLQWAMQLVAPVFDTHFNFISRIPRTSTSDSIFYLVCYCLLCLSGLC